MTPDDFQEFRHRAVHRLMDLNKDCNERFRIGEWERWDYDLDAGTLVFSEAGAPKVIAQVQVVGTTSTTSKTWLWAWANESLPSGVTTRMSEVRKFGQEKDLPQLTDSTLPDDEYLGWELTAIAAQIIGAKGAYRCPSENGFLYLVYMDLQFADSGAIDWSESTSAIDTIECGQHGSGKQTFVCEHLAANPSQPWFSDVRTASNLWPDAWCSQCNAIYEEQGEWNDTNSGRINIRLLCHRCYESLRSQEKAVT